jgi:signal transduction histidine kinase
MSFAEIAALTIHDVKNNLAKLAAEAEARGDRHSLQIALEAADALTRLLCFYKAENGLLQLQIDAHNPVEMLEDLISAQASEQSSAESFQPRVKIQTKLEDAPVLCFCDRTLIHMVLNNALQNAQRYAKSMITISVLEDLDGGVLFRIQDDGSGYPENALQGALEANAVTQAGTGLGLLLARRVLAMHFNQGQSGTLHLSNHDGARFELRLP